MNFKFSLKNKATEAALRGYILFKVNGKIYLNYNKALKAKCNLVEQQSVYLIGFHIFKGWKTLYIKIYNPDFKKVYRF